MNLILTALTLGFLGSFHCVGMCGPIALALPLDRSSPLSKYSGTLIYNIGRMFTYALLGGFFGLLGESFVIAGYQQTVSITLGIVILIIVLFYWKPPWLYKTFSFREKAQTLHQYPVYPKKDVSFVIRYKY